MLMGQSLSLFFAVFLWFASRVSEENFRPSEGTMEWVLPSLNKNLGKYLGEYWGDRRNWGEFR